MFRKGFGGFVVGLGPNLLIEQPTVSNGVAFSCCTCNCSFVLWHSSSGRSAFLTSFGKTMPPMRGPSAALRPELQHAACVGLVPSLGQVQHGG